MKISYRGLLVKFLIVLLVISGIYAYGTITANSANDDGPESIGLYPADYFFTLTEDQNGKVVEIPVDSSTGELQDLIDQGKIKLEFNRDSAKPYSDAALFPNQKKGGLIGDWKTSGGASMFDNVAMSPVEKDGKVYLSVTMDVKTYFTDRWGAIDFSVPHINGGAYLDICGYFNLNAKVDNDIVGSVATKIIPYNKFHTMDEMYAAMDKMAKANTDTYVEKFSMGTSTGGKDMPYLIIAKDKASVDAWLKFTNDAEKDPDAALAAIRSGNAGNLKVPVFYSNVHANETAASDGILDFAWKLITQNSIDYKYLTGFTEEGETALKNQMGAVGGAGNLAIPDLVKDKASYLGFIKGGANDMSTVVDLNKYYNVDDRSVDVSALLDDVFFIIVPEENVDGRQFLTRTGLNGYDFNRDNAFQTTEETKNMQRLIGKFNPLVLTEFHGRIKNFQCEPCDPPHEPNFEYDILSRHLMKAGEALGIAAVANNKSYNSYAIPMRDYLSYTGNKTGDGKDETYWADPWDDMSTSYTPQFAMLHGTVAYTVELPAYSDDTTIAASYGMLGQAKYVSDTKLDLLKNQVEIFKRGADNYNSNGYDEVGQWFADQHDVEGAESKLFRPEYDSPGENGNFYPEAYIIPLNGSMQNNIQAAKDMLTWLGRNDVKVNFAEKSFTLDGKTYPKGTPVVSMYQAKRSVANGVLYDGTFIDTWSTLYSEGVTSFNKSRGFDMEKVTRPADFETIKAALGTPQDADGINTNIAQVNGAFEGKEKADVVIYNTSIAAVEAVNALLKDGYEVGMITEGELMGNFVCSNAAYEKAKFTYNYVFKAKGLYGKNTIVAKKILKPADVYVVGKPASNSAGFIDTTLVSAAYDYNYDRMAMKLMGFKMTEDVAASDVILGASDLNKNASALAAVKAGKPYIGYGREVGKIQSSLFSGNMNRKSLGGLDLFAYVTYPEKTLVNASYINKADPLLYGYGMGYFSKVPEGSKILVKTDGGRKPMEGFISTEQSGDSAISALLDGSIQGFEYTGNSMDVVLFANTLTNKVHQRDEYTYISNFIFSRTLGDAYTAFTTEPPDPDVDDGQPGKNEIYRIIKGADSTWLKGSKQGLLIASNASFSKFKDVLIDGKTLANKKDYAAAEGSTVITLSRDYLEALEVGEHNITIQSSDGLARGKFTVKKSSASVTTGKGITTGDNSNFPIYLSVLAIAVIGGALLLFFKKRSHK